MREFKELKEVFPRTFGEWMSENDIKRELDRRWTSREDWFFDKNGIGTQTIKDANIVNNECDGYFNLRIEGEEIKVILHFTFEDWDEEEQTYLEESSVMIGWE